MSAEVLPFAIRPPETVKKMAFADVVKTTMLMKSWLAIIRDQQNDERDRISDINVSLVFDPPAITALLVESRMGSRSGSRNPSRIGSATDLRSLCATPNGSLPFQSNMDHSASNKPDTASTTPMAELEALADQHATESTAQRTQETKQHQPPPPVQPAPPPPALPEQELFPVAIDLDALEELHAEPPETFSHKVLFGLRKFLKWLQNIPFFSIDPTKSFYYYWSFLIYMGVLYNCAMCVIYAYDIDNGFYRYWFTGNIIFDCVFIMDIFFNSKLIHMEEGSTVTHWRKLLTRYTHSKEFLLDILAIVPTDLFLLVNQHLCIIRANRLVKLYRVRDFIDYANMRTNFPNFLKILNIAVLCLVIFHWNAALYFVISRGTGINSTAWADEWTGWPWQFTWKKNPEPIYVPCLMKKMFNHSLQCVIFDESSPKFLEEFHNISYHEDTSEQEEDRLKYIHELAEYWQHAEHLKLNISVFVRQYVLSMYWSSLTMTTRGQQPYPTHNSHNVLEIFDTIIGMIIFAVIVSGAENLIASMNKDSSEIQGLLDGLKFYMNYRNVSESMQKRVVEFIMFTKKYGSTKDEEDIMTSMPPRLQGELAVHLHMENLKRVELLKNCEANLLYELVLRLQMHVFSPNDYLCQVGDVAKEMYIVKTGVLEVLSDEGKVFSKLREGNTFGELSILKLSSGQRGYSHKRMRALRSVGYSDVYILRQEDALEVLHDYPAVRSQLIEKAQEMIRQRNHELADQEGIQEFHQIDDIHSIEETLSAIAKSIKGCERDIEQMYENFHTKSAEYKQRVTTLERIYTDNRRAIKNDILNGNLVL